MKELGNFFESVREDCSDTPLVEAVEQATRCIFAEAAETEAPATTETATETITDEPTAEETAPTADDGLNLDATPAPDADTVNSEPDTGTPGGRWRDYRARSTGSYRDRNRGNRQPDTGARDGSKGTRNQVRHVWRSP